MCRLICGHIRRVIGKHNVAGSTVVVSRCEARGKCVPTQGEIAKLPSLVVVACEGCPLYVARKAPEQVGSMLKAILDECGVVPPAGCDCKSWMRKMDNWGIEGCRANRALIVGHLNEAATKSDWYEAAKVGLRGYLTTGSLVDEAILRCEE